MTPEDKKLLLKDLCARLPYGVKVYLNTDMYSNWTGDYILTAIKSQEHSVQCSVKHFSCWCDLKWVKPYLFPLSSMTEEQKKEQEAHFTCIKHDMSFSICRYMEGCYKNHLDVNDLIPKGLALDASGLNIY